MTTISSFAQFTAPFRDGAIGIAWPIPSEKKPGAMVCVVGEGLMPDHRSPRYRVFAEFEETRLSDLHRQFRTFMIANRSRVPRGIYANTLDLAMFRAWKLHDAMTGSPIRISQAMTLWAPNNLEHYLNLILEHRPLDADQDKRKVLFNDGSQLVGHLMKQAPAKNDKKIDDYPPIAALGFALEALKLTAHRNEAPKPIRLRDAKGWT